ncbi:MAG: cobalamin B12-binding domain-containing protein [Phycisphaerae bacterium]
MKTIHNIFKNNDSSVVAAIDLHRGGLTDRIIQRVSAVVAPRLRVESGRSGPGELRDQIEPVIDHLTEAVRMADPSIFVECIKRLQVWGAAHGMPGAAIVQMLELLRDQLAVIVDAADAALLMDCLSAAQAIAAEQPVTSECHIQLDQPLGSLAREYLAALLDGRRQDAGQLVEHALQSGISVQEIYVYVFQQAQYELGRLWELNRISVAQEHYCTAATQFIMSRLYPRIFSGPRNGYCFVGAAVASDMHEIGIRMVADTLEMHGWVTHYLGGNVPISDLIDTLLQRRADVLGISATIVPHIRTVEKVIAAVRQADATKRIRVMVGGAPFNAAPELWKKIGADGWAKSAVEVPRVALELALGRSEL